MKKNLIPYKQGQTGLYEDKPDHRDLKLGAIAGVSTVDWGAGYKQEAPIKIEHQGSSLSCVGQAASKYGEVLDYHDSGKKTDLSAKSIYGLIYLPNGGAYLRDGAKKVVDRGVNLEKSVPSYVGGLAPSEDFMRDFTANTKLDEEASEYKGLKYFSTGRSIDELALAIQTGNGVMFGLKGKNDGWGNSNGLVMPPTTGADWAHAIYGCEFMMKDEKKTIKFANSWGDQWGDKGFGYVNEDYFVGDGKFIFNGWTIIDILKLKNMLQILKVRGDENPDYYLVGNGKKKMIADMRGYADLLRMGLPEVQEVESLDALEPMGTYIEIPYIIN